MQKIILRKNEERRIFNGHLWIFSNEIEKKESEIQSGETVLINDYRGNFIGYGFYNSNSLIAVRILTRDQKFDLQSLLENRLISAYNFRKSVYPNRDSFRLVFSESDFIPGLIIDKYNDSYVLQVYSAGVEKNIDLILEVLKQELGAKNIFTKHDEYFRKLEGLSEENKIYLGNAAEEIISDGAVKYKVNFEMGQKTGFFFDQCDNREYLGKFCKDKSVLDCFCNSGGFGLHAAVNGAKNLVFVDSSKEEVENVKNNRALNELVLDAEYVCSDVFDYLERCISENKKFDVINIDPPAFAKSKKNLPKAVKGYEKLNRLAMQVVREDGLLFSSSCSHHLDKDSFIELIGTAAAKAKKKAQIIYFNSASLDHPSLPAMPETSYLKFIGLRIS